MISLRDWTHLFFEHYEGFARGDGRGCSFNIHVESLFSRAKNIMDAVGVHFRTRLLFRIRMAIMDTKLVASITNVGMSVNSLATQPRPNTEIAPISVVISQNPFPAR